MDSLPVLNLAEAKFECTFGRGCDGICCKNGRPAVGPEERARIEDSLEKATPHLRPAAQLVLEKEGYVSRRHRQGQPMLRVVEGWCIFFHNGCVLHKIGASEGDPFRYKPTSCSLFPLARDEESRWYVRQWGYDGEAWDLFCLVPHPSTPPASQSLRQELQLAADITAQEEVTQSLDSKEIAASA